MLHQSCQKHLVAFCLSNVQHPLSKLADYFKLLPGVGEKTAYRLAFHILTLPEESVQNFSSELIETKKCIQSCESCYNISSEKYCEICKDAFRNQATTLCVVSEPKDVWTIEKTNSFKGLYHVLGGLISPLDGIHPEMLRIQELVKRIREKHFTEIILAINPTVEGDVTMLYLKDLMAKFKLKVTKLAYGLPMGSEIEYADQMTLQKSSQGRIGFND